MGKDTEIIFQCKAGRTGNLGLLAEKYEVPLLSYIVSFTGNRFEAEDIFQDVFVRILKGARNFAGASKSSTWIYTITRNLCINFLAKKKESTPFSNEEQMVEFSAQSLKDAGENPDREIELREAGMAIKKVVQSLPPGLKEAVLLRYFNGLSYKEIAEVTGEPIGTVGYRIHEALKAMKVELESLRELVEQR